MPDIQQHASLVRKYSVLEIGDNSSSLYCPGRLAYDWENGQFLDECKPGDYEERLLRFFLRDPGASSDSSAFNTTVVVGGIGTGKSTTIRGVLQEARKRERDCSRLGKEKQCSQPPRIILIDFRREQEPPDDEVEGLGVSEVEEFWGRINAALRLERKEAPSFEEEVTHFWRWALNCGDLAIMSPDLFGKLTAVEGRIRAALGEEPYLGWSQASVLESLAGYREDLFSSERTGLSVRDQAVYKAFLLAYTARLEQRPCKCSYLFVDNVDQLGPRYQRTAVDFAARLSELIPARTVIAVRPLTWERSVHGHSFVNRELHRSPPVAEVIAKRFRTLIKAHEGELSSVERGALRSLSTVLSGRSRNPLVKRMVDATAGLSVRYALRNTNNMVESPFCKSVPSGPGYFEDMQMSQLAGAFFRGGRGTEGSLIPHAFEHLYQVGENSSPEAWLVKPRLLDLLFRVREGRAETRDLFFTLKPFGYGDLFEKAMLELLRRSRPLIWSEDGFRKVKPDSAARVAITPIGRGYIMHMFGEVFYDEMCLHRDALPANIDGMKAIYEFHRLLYAQDMRESKQAKGAFGAKKYFSIYSEDIPGLTVLHALKMLKGLPHRLKDRVDYDSKRADFLKREFLRELGPVPKREPF